MNIRKYENRYVACISFEKEVYDAVNKMLPRGVCISDEINEFMKQRKADLEREQNLGVTDKSAVKIIKNNSSNRTTNTKQQEFDIYCSTPDMVHYVSSINDVRKVLKLRGQGQKLMNIANIRAKKIKNGESAF